MQPGFELRLRTMMKAISEVVLPAIDPANRQAQEQARLVLGSLEVIRQQIDFAHWYESADLISLCNLAVELMAIKDAGRFEVLGELRGNGVALISRWDVSLPQLREASRALREAISAAVDGIYAEAPQVARSAVHKLVLSHAEGQLSRERAFIAGTRWDGYPESLLSIEDSLRKARALA